MIWSTKPRNNLSSRSVLLQRLTYPRTLTCTDDPAQWKQEIDQKVTAPSLAWRQASFPFADASDGQVLLPNGKPVPVVLLGNKVRHSIFLIKSVDTGANCNFG